MSRRLVVLVSAIFLGACASAPKVVVDPRSIGNEAKYRTDMHECHQLALTYDKRESTAGTTAVAGAAGGVTVAGVATAVSGAVFPPAIPFIVAGAAAAGTLGGGLTKMSETESRERILAACLTDRGYRAYSPH